MHYLILNYVTPPDRADAPRDTDDGPLWGAYTKAMIDAGVFVTGNALQPAATATTVRLRAGQRDIADGPYAATKEQLGGYYVIDAPDLDSALAWAARNPAAATGAVEVRPIVR